MNHCTWTILAAAAVIAAASAEEKESALDRDRKALQGIWVVAAAYQGGEKVTDSERATGATLYAVKIKDDRFQISLEKSGDEFRFAGDPVPFSLDVSVAPRIIEFDISASEKGYCIYSIKGDDLTLALNYSDGVLGASVKDRAKLPKKLESKPGDGTYVFVLKKAKVK